MRLYELPAHKLHGMLQRREITSLELTEAVLERLEGVEPRLKAFITLTPDRARETARQVDERIAQGERVAPLAGIPVAVKDNMCLKDVRTTCASRMLHNYVPPYTATAVDRLLAQGAVVVGKTNMDEFAFGSSTENSAFGGTRNPWDTSRVPGGSSGGSAAVVAAGAAVVALGSDTGGSIRQPASLCGVAGLKPTYGRVSRYGLVAFASSLDQIGPFGRDVIDCALVLQSIAGHDPMDSTSSRESVPDYLEDIDEGVSGMRIGIPTELMGEGLQPGVRGAIEEAVSIFERLGARVDEVSLPYVGYSIPTYYLIAPSEASSNLARFDGVRYAYRAEGFEDVVEMYKKTRGEGFGKEAKRRIMLGTYALSAGYYQAFYGQAQRVRTLIMRDFEQAFGKYDVLISPTSPTTAFGIGEKMADPLQMYLSDVCTAPINLAGLPGISIPCGLAGGLPVGLQIIGKHLDEATVLRTARAFETASESIGLPEVA